MADMSFMRVQMNLEHLYWSFVKRCNEYVSREKEG